MKGERHPTCGPELNPGRSGERRTCYHGATKPRSLTIYGVPVGIVTARILVGSVVPRADEEVRRLYGCYSPEQNSHSTVVVCF